MAEFKSDNFSQFEGARLNVGSRPGLSIFYIELVKLLVIFLVVPKKKQ